MTNEGLVYLVNAGNDSGMASIANDHCFPALSVLALGTWLDEKISGIQVVARDGGVMPQEEILQDIQQRKPKVVGVSVLCSSYKNSLEIVQCAKENGAYTILGNDQAAQLSHEILDNRPYVDFVLGSEYGEAPLELLVRHLQGEPITLGEIPDLTFRAGANTEGFQYDRDKAQLAITKSKAYAQSSRMNALDVFPVVDRSLFPDSHWEAYLKKYLEKFSWLHPDEEITGVTTMNRARGCSRGKQSDKCNFCDMLLDVSFSTPERFWEEVESANKQVNANVFYEVCDSFSSFPKLVEQIVEKRPNLDFNPNFFVYAQARELVNNPKLVGLFKELGVFRVNMGLESGSNVTLQHMKGPNDNVKSNYRALNMLQDAGIHGYTSFVLGCDAETPTTLQETVGWAKKIIDEKLVVDVSAQPIVPLPQNVLGKKLIASGLLPESMRQTDWPWDVDRLSEIYIEKFSGVSYNSVLEAAREIREYAKEKRIGWGSGASMESNYNQKEINV
ncbi:MAG: B12-binding domain-containing radical SAM protein [Candidatus Nanoarchaeia archaeon]